jgi:SPOR domain
MAEEQSQRPYRASEPPLRSHADASNNDPLAELARLIGQTDPFGEFGRDTTRRSAAPANRADWNTSAPNSPYVPREESDWRAPAQRSDGNRHYNARGAVGEQTGPTDYDDQSYGRQTYGGEQMPTRDDLYQADHEARGYPSGQADHQYDTYEQDATQHLEDEYYDQAPSSRRRLGVMAIAGVIGLALIGTAGAFGYRALFGSSGSTQPPPVIKADAGPSKVVPATNSKDAQSNKLITERVNERGQSEKLVSREEQPIDKPTAVALSQPAPQSSLGSGVVGSEPKKVRTIAIRPDQPVDTQAAAPLATPAATRAPQAPAAPSRPAAVPARPADNMSADADSNATPAPAARSAPPVRQATPLSLNPDASPARAQARPAAPPTQTAAVAPQAAAPAPAASDGGSGSFVQVSSQRSEAEAQTAFRGLQAKFPTQLGSRELQIRKADLGAKGTYYRAMVGPFASPAEAAELCSSLKAAGGQCFTSRN